MPRRQVKEVPRWRRGQQQSSGPAIRLSPKQEKALVARLAAQAGLPAPASSPAIPGMDKALAATGTYRYRRHLIPFAWLAWVLAWGLGTNSAHNIKLGLVVALITAGGIWLLTRHLPDCPEGSPRKHTRCFTRHAWQAMAALAALWIPALCLTGFAPHWPHLLVALYRALVLGSALAVIGPWVKHYRFRPAGAPAPEVAKLNDYVTWNALTAEKKWKATLGPVEALPGGGRRYPVRTDGIKTTIGNILGAPENVSGAWHKPMTEAYAERSPDGITSSGYLTVLAGDTLMRVQEWNGAGIDPETGIARMARFADNAAAHMKFFTPRYGTRHALISGTTGSGKSELLNLLLFIAIECGYIVPVVLDPQEGQSLPYWQDRCLYAPGRGECLQMLRGLHAGMLDRSRYLASLKWDDDGVPMRGMGFFDHVLTGLPIPLILFDEAHMVLSGDSKDTRKAVELTLEIGRLGRKTGTALWLGTHLPSLSDLGGEQALRDMLRGGNVVTLRTANSVASGMLGLEKDPSKIQPYFTDGKETTGLGYVVGPDNRPDAPMRTDLVPKAMKRRNPVVPALDDRFAEAMDRAMRMGGVQLQMPAAASLAAVPAPAEEEPAPPGRTASDAILAVLDEAAGELDRGELIIRCKNLATGSWGRAKPFAVRTMALALANLEASRQIARPRHSTYAPIRTTIHVLPDSDHATSTAPGA
jgi:hypothetical protein